MSDRLISDEERAALELLSKNHRLLVVLIPSRATADYAKAMSRVIGTWLDELRVPPTPHELEP